jgi:hypothetical protein
MYPGNLYYQINDHITLVTICADCDVTPFDANQMTKINETERQVQSRSVSVIVGLLLQSKSFCKALQISYLEFLSFVHLHLAFISYLSTLNN